ncbi:MerR family transcriptional regulator [Kribbella sp. NBC_01505]|uniref:MerR family transcriptional regulator n=1 Tax=Kribbella sp. NBC_01505 TaxID=2903580 RepID=UPI00386B7BB1
MGNEFVGIGAAAALYGLPVSTVRWWEKQGVVTPPVGPDGKRRYGEHELRQLGLAQLCRASGMMSLDEIAVITAAGTTAIDRRHVIDGRLEVLEQQIAELTAARAYLQHIAVCRHGCATECPYLTDDLRVNTDWRLFDTPDLLSAARQAYRSG